MQTTSENPPITVIIPTRNRGASIVDAVKSVLANDYPDFELVVIDQSSNNLTEQALAPFKTDPRLRYVPSSEIGSGACRNSGAKAARTELLAYTDDDCEVPPGWLKAMVQALNYSPQIGLVFGNVLAGPHDAGAGFIPSYERTTPFLARSIRDKNEARGIGACMGLRRSAWEAVGGFDPALGSGSHFKSGEEMDLVIKLLLKDYYVYETPDLSVIHYGFRTFEQGKNLTKNHWFSIGACYVKHLKIGHVRAMLPIIAHDGFLAFKIFATHSFKARRPKRLMAMVAMAAGFAKGALVAVDKTSGNYALKPAETLEPALAG